MTQAASGFAKTIVVKDARSPERLLDETALFLHRSPASAARTAAHDAGRAACAPTAAWPARKVLIVDDDLRNIFALTTLLERQQMAGARSPRTAATASSVLEKDPAIEIVLMDIMMPEMDGYDTMRAIRKHPASSSRCRSSR